MTDHAQAFGYLFGISMDVMVATIDATTGIITAQTGDAVAGITDSNGAELWQTFGFASLPSPPSGGASGAQCIAIKRATGDIIIAGRDARTGQIWGNLQPGETCIFASGADGGGQARIMLKQDGSVTMYTTEDNTSTGAAMMARLSPPNSSGGGGFEVVVPGATLKLGPNGFHVVAGAATLDLGSIQGLPGPLAALGSYFTVSAGTATVNSPMTLLGPSLSPLGYNPVAYGLAANPLTMPPVPILSLPLGVPIGLICSSAVFTAAP